MAASKVKLVCPARHRSVDSLKCHVAARMGNVRVELDDGAAKPKLELGDGDAAAITDATAIIMHCVAQGTDSKASATLLQWLSFSVSELKPFQFAG